MPYLSAGVEGFPIVDLAEMLYEALSNQRRTVTFNADVRVDFYDIKDALTDYEKEEIADEWYPEGPYDAVRNYVLDQIRRIEVSGFDRPAIEVLEEIERIISNG